MSSLVQKTERSTREISLRVKSTEKGNTHGLMVKTMMGISTMGISTGRGLISGMMDGCMWGITSMDPKKEMGSILGRMETNMRVSS